MKKILKVIGKLLCALLLVLVLAVLVTGISPIYRFPAPRPFSGPDIFNPYAKLDSAFGWKRSVFHVHTRVKGPFPPNECPQWPAWVDSVYRNDFGYEIVTFSNHNELTRHPTDSSLQVNVYEQGYSPFKFHKLVFGSRKVVHWDPLLPVLASQRQAELNYLGAGSDFIQFNHPLRTLCTGKSQLEKLSGYRIMELDSGISTENEYWDWALSAGHYSFGLANDDLHHPEDPWCIAVRCNFLCTPSGQYADLKRVLLEGGYYAMRVPDWGNEGWEVKYARNRSLPSVTAIGLRDSTVYIALSQSASRIVVNGQDHAVLAEASEAQSLEYQFKSTDSYARITAYFPDGAVIYTNPWARYDAASQDTPYTDNPHQVNWLLTLLYNLLVLLAVMGVLRLMGKLFKKK